MIKLLTSPWFSAPLGAVLYLASMLVFWKTPQPALPERDPSASAFSGPSWEFRNPEADQLMTELKSEKGALALRKQQLDDWAARLDAQRQELTAATLAVRQMQDQFDQSVVRLQEVEVPNLKKLAKVYADMTPDGAATVMSQLEDSVNVKVMLFMKESETAAILETMAKKGPAEAKRAAALSEHVRLSIAHKALPAK
jgi:flagellar motility protein MotE (MotC chaperone)